MFSERETNSNQSQVGFLIDLNWSSCLRNRSPCVIMAASSDPEALVADKLSKIYQTLGVPPVSSDTLRSSISRSIITCYDVTNRFDLYPGYVLTESGTFFRSNSRWYGCCDWLLVPRGVSLDSHRTWTDSWCADLLPRNKRIHSRNKCIHSRKTVSVSRI